MRFRACFSFRRFRLDAQFQDIVPNERIIFCYRMTAGAALLSVSLSTAEFKRSVAIPS
jgi:hypothetical protein